VGGARVTALRGVVAGAGALGPFWAREVVESRDTELAGWVDLDAARVRVAAGELALDGVPTGASLERMLAEQRPDFVVNVTAPAAHRVVTLAALEAGAAVLTEKPLAMSLDDALEMIEAADRAGRLLMVSQNRRYMPELAAFRESVAGLGPLSSLSCEFFRNHRNTAAEFLFGFPQPLLLDMSIHLFDVARAITGADPLSVYCESYNPPWSWYAGPAAAAAVFRMSGGLRFSFVGNWAAPTNETSWTGAWRAVGENGIAIWDGEDTADRDPERFLGLEGALADFVTALRTGTVPAGECHDNLRSLAMCHAAVASAALGAAVPVTYEAAPR
jgi:predicted dehydrogenase